MSKKAKKESKPKKLHCPQCNAEVEQDDEFCVACGKLLLLDEDYDAHADEMDEEWGL